MAAVGSKTKLCWNQGCQEVAPKLCGYCRTARYCSKVCQEADWDSRHRARCVPKEEAPQKVVEVASSLLVAGNFDTTFAKFRVKLPQEPFLYGSTQDFGAVVETLFMSRGALTQQEGAEYEAKGLDKNVVQKESKSFIEGYLNEMQLLSKRLGFKLHLSSMEVAIRDHFQLANTGVIYNCSSDKVTAADAMLMRSAERVIDHPFFSRATALSAYHASMRTATDILGHPDLAKARTLPFYFEGGNLFLVTNAQGKKRAIIGEESLELAHLQLRLTHFFAKVFQLDDFKKKWEALSQVEEEAIADQMQGFGILDEARSQREQVVEFVAQRDFLLTMGFPMFLGAEETIFLPQVGYHLDTFMHPGPKGSIFLQDYQFTLQLLEEIKAQAKALGLTKQDEAILEEQIKSAKTLADKLGERVSVAKTKLEKGGFIVIPIPGVFFDLSGKTKTNFNFLNCVTGFSTKTKRPYYITGKALMGEQLGNVLMRAFTSYLQLHVPDLDVFYIGDKEEMALWNNPNQQLGLHCLTAEIAVKADKI